MGSSYLGEPNFGNERGSSTTGGGVGGSSSSSSRKGKKSNSEKPKQPQRGLGVAQLEKIRLTGQMCHPSSLQTPYSTNFNINDEIRAQSANYPSIPSSSFSYTSTSSSSSLSYGFNTNIMMGLGDYERTNIRYGDSQPTTTPRSSSMGSSSQNSEPSETQELDLELRLSL
ncbi:hypothetical protein FNV43_RR15815 [Rhamnella rubrinervis]|uniref:Uncharacterized protein n=1 Tax=Rhamnella rubrinervis TaxID=2594499 RepID=A0A8K0E9S0_9ROSA|nr:hypothetical protein FNV43_RR15815 [Rhamnella rubrinervis]